MQILLFILALLFGGAIGSFLNVVILRLPKEQSLNGRSHCVSCNHILGFFDLVPIFSFLFLGGKCRYCGKKISPRYFIIEMVCAALFGLSCWLIQPADLYSFILLGKYWLICAVLIVVFVVDLEHYLILDSVIFPAVILAAAFNIALDIIAHRPILSLASFFVSGILAAVFAALPFFLVWYFSKGQWMGFGDVKLALFLGTALLMPVVFAGVMAGVLLGGAVSAALLAFTKKTLKSRLAFGTFLSLGSLGALFYGPQLIHWYLAILGF